MRIMAEALLTLNDVRAGYGDSVVLDKVAFELPENGSLAVLGRNGVGKSTLFLTIMGLTTFRRGAIVWRGRDITRLTPHRRALLGIGWVAQEREIFPSLTVEENLDVAARSGPWDIARVTDLFPRLAEFTVVDNVDPDIGLLAHHLGHRLAQPGGVGGIIATIATRAGSDHLDHIVGPRQTAGVSRENPIGAVHSSLPDRLRTSPRFAGTRA